MTRHRWIVLAAALAALVAVGMQTLPADSGAEPDKAESPYEPRIHAGPDGRARLGGPWIVRLDPRDRGKDLGWRKGGFTGKRVRLPYVPQATKIRGEAGKRNFRGSIAWYRTRIAIPRDGTYALRFESVNHVATVWVDGKKEVRHEGEYLPFEVRRFFRAGDHEIVVRADWRNPARMKREGWHRLWFNFGGINRDVSIRELGPSEIVHPMVNTTLTPEGDAIVDVKTHLRNRGLTRTLRLEGTLTFGDREVEIPFEPELIGKNRTEILRTRVVIEDPALWSPDDPELWDLRLEVPGESGYDARVGLRELRHVDRRLLLNGERLVLRGASIHEDAKGRGDALLPEHHARIVADLKALGANATRSQHPLHPALLERLDAAGIVVWQGVGPTDSPGNWTSKTERLRRQSRDRVLDTLFQAQLHPSIITWNLANEVAGDGHPDGQAPWIDAMARELKRRDPSRPIALDIWGKHPPQRPSLMYRNVDLIGWTNYIGWYEANGVGPEEIARRIQERLDALREALPGKAIFVTEFGAEANGRNEPDAPGGYAFQADLLATHFRAYRADEQLNGAILWNLRDFAVAPSFAGGSIRNEVPDIELVKGLNQKGLLTYGGRPKPSFRAVREQLAALAARDSAR